VSQYKVCVYAISKNEGKFVDRWMDSMSEADCIVVTDTGSSDDTVERLRARGALVYEKKITPWRFDVARNLSLDHVPDDCDIAVCTDLDEVFHVGWRAILEANWQPDTTMAHYKYNWSLYPDGKPKEQFLYFKIHKKSEFRWKCPIHEYLEFVGKGHNHQIIITDLILDHLPDPHKSRSTYLPLLEMAVAEDPDSDRMTYYLGREYMYAKRWQECIETLERHLQLPKATWKEERCASMRWIAKAHMELGDYRLAYRWYLRAIAEFPDMRDPYVEFSICAYRKKDWTTSWYAAEESLKIDKKSAFYINMGYAWDFTPHDLAAIASYQLGMYDRSYLHSKKALEMDSTNSRLQKNSQIIRDAIQGTKIQSA
jgi:tetratricopeptide (TPR) repeat protein